MNDKPVEKIISAEINYDEVVEGKPPEPKIDFELFISHCTKTDSEKELLQRNFVIAIEEQIRKIQEITTFFDKNDIHSSPINIINQALEGSRIIVPICTPEYIKKFKQNNSWPNIELGAFVNWSTSQPQERIIPVLLDITHTEFNTQGVGIAVITNKQCVVIPSDYPTNKDIIEDTAKDIVRIYNDYLKQWNPSS